MSLVIENIAAALIIAVVISLSKRTALACVILAFYAVYIALDIAFVSDGMANDAVFWYMTMAVIDLVVMCAVCMMITRGTTNQRVAFVYLIYLISFNLVPDLIQAGAIKTEIRYVSSSVYEYIMIYAIPFDILIAVLSSENRVSKFILQGRN